MQCASEKSGDEQIDVTSSLANGGLDCENFFLRSADHFEESSDLVHCIGLKE